MNFPKNGQAVGSIPTKDLLILHDYLA